MIRRLSSSLQQLRPRPVPGALEAPRVLGLLLPASLRSSPVVLAPAHTCLENAVPRTWTFSSVMRLWLLALAPDMV